MSFAFSLTDKRKSFLWAVFEIRFQELTGLLVLEYASSKDKKEIAFERGQPLAIRSTRRRDRLWSFMTESKRLTVADQETLLELFPQEPSDQELISWLLQSSKVDAAELPKLLETYFTERLFDALTLQRGELKFHPLDAIPEKVLSLEMQRLTKDVQEVIWQEWKSRADSSYCQTRLNAVGARELQVSGELPLALGPADLKLWQQLAQAPQDWRLASHEAQCFFVLAYERGLLVEKKDDFVAYEDELKAVLNEKNFFQLFGVSEQSSVSELRPIYLQMIKKYHPDRLPSNAPAHLQQLCEDVLSHVNEAHSCLSHPEKREEYQAELELEKMGGREVIERKIKAEFEYEDIRRLMARKLYDQCLDRLEALSNVLEDDALFMADLLFCRAMNLKTTPQKEMKLREIRKGLSDLKSQVSDASAVEYYEGMLWKMLGDEKAALECFERALGANPRHSEAATELRVLENRLGRKGR